jgi:two-component system, OmpR family, sensor histidine kinase KdpD
MATSRPGPDALLDRFRAAERRTRRGKLKIFFGAAPGVGKTYSMLEAAQRLRAGGADVVVGWVDTHGRPETAALLVGLALLRRHQATYRGIALEELDIDAALRRHPALLLVDELAHTNAEGSRHRKRWQDVMELLDAGIDVWSTVNVQHLESLNDVVAQITSIRVRETIPDSVLDQADELELVDLPPEALIERLQQGKVYLPEQAQRAVSHFFRKGNLLALRELALRSTAERVDADVRAYRVEHGIETTWPAAERILVCVGPGPHAARLVRAARRMAAGLRADWTAVYVEIPAHARLPQEDRDWVTQHLRLAESLGARVARLAGDSVSAALLAYAREHNVTRVLVGKPTRSHWRDFFGGSLLDQLIRGSADIEVHVSSGDPVEGASRRPPAVLNLHSRPASYFGSLATVALATAVAFLMRSHFQTTDLVLVFLLATTYVAVRFGRGPSLLAATLGVAIFDFFFVPPRFTFTVADVIYLPTFGVMLVVGLIVSTLATRVRERAEAARAQAEWSATLHAFARELAHARDVNAIAAATARQIEAALGGTAAVLVARGEGALAAIPGASGFALDESEAAVARWAYEHGQPAGQGTDTLPGTTALYLPLQSGARALGVVGFRSAEGRPLTEANRRQMLEALAQQAASALERALLAEEAEQIELRARTEELRNSLLSSVSHDLRTPLAAIVGSATALLTDNAALSATQRTDLVRTIQDEAEHLSRLVANLLAMTRLESGHLAVAKEWVPIEEIVGSALERLGKRLEGRPLAVHVPRDGDMALVDPVLVEQVLVNLIENVVQHTPADTPIAITASREEGVLLIDVQDRGPGLPAGSELRVFDKFFRGPAAAPGGSGLGLAICRGVVVAHGGTIEAENRPGGGALFRLRLPIEGQPPQVPPESDGERGDEERQ